MIEDDKIKQLEHENELLRQKLNGFSRKLEENTAHFSMIREIGLALMYISNFRLSCRTILDVIIKNTIAQNCSIMLMDYEQNQLFLIAATDPDKKNYTIEAKNVFSKEGIRYSLRSGEGAAGSAIREKKNYTYL